MWIQKQAESLCQCVSNNTYRIIITLYEYSMIKNNINQFVVNKNVP